MTGLQGQQQERALQSKQKKTEEMAEVSPEIF